MKHHQVHCYYRSQKRGKSDDRERLNDNCCLLTFSVLLFFIVKIISGHFHLFGVTFALQFRRDCWFIATLGQRRKFLLHFASLRGYRPLDLQTIERFSAAPTGLQQLCKQKNVTSIKRASRKKMASMAALLTVKIN